MRKSLQLLTGHTLILRGLEREDLRFEGGGRGVGRKDSVSFTSITPLFASLVALPFPETPSRTLGTRLRIHPRLRVV